MSQHPINDDINNYYINNVWNNYTSAGLWSRILAWLSPLEPWLWHEKIRAHRVNEVGEWLLETPEYRRWFRDGNEGDADGSTLFCYGSLGVGKTHIK